MDILVDTNRSFTGLNNDTTLPTLLETTHVFNVSNEVHPIASQIYIIYMYFMFSFGVSENLLVILVFIRHPPGSTTDSFIFSVIFCDFLTSLLNVPIYASLENGWWKFFGYNSVCKTHMFISQTLVLSSSFLIAGLAIDRYLKICKPHIPYDRKKAIISCICIIFLTTLLSLPSIALYEAKHGSCKVKQYNIALFAYYIMVFVIFVSSTIIIIFSDASVTARVKQVTTRMNKWNASECNENQREEIFITSGIHNHCSEESLESKLTQDVVLTNYEIIAASSHVSESELNEITVNVNPETSNTIDNCTQTQITPDGFSNNLRPHGNSSESSRTSKLAFLVCAVYILTWLPAWAMLIIAIFPTISSHPITKSIGIFAKKAFLINTVANPITYVWLNTKFRSLISLPCTRVQEQK